MDTPKRPSERLVESLLKSLPLPDYFGPRTLATHMGETEAWVLAGIAAGEIPAKRIRGCWVISKAAFNAALARTNGGAS